MGQPRLTAPPFPPHPPQYGAIDSYLVAARWLDGHGEVWDWGCGQRFAARFFRTSPYRGIDGNFNGEHNVDLAALTSIQCDSILMRHVLENNPAGWREILTNAVRAFRRRMALVTFTGFVDSTRVCKVEEYPSGPLTYLQFRKADLTEIMGPLLLAEQSCETSHPEHVFLLERR